MTQEFGVFLQKGKDNSHTICHENSLIGENIQQTKLGRNYYPPKKKNVDFVGWE